MKHRSFSSYQSLKRILMVVYSAIFAGLILFFILVWFIAPELNSEYAVLQPHIMNVFIYIDLAVVLLLVPGINFLYRLFLNKNVTGENLSSMLTGYLQTKIIIWAIIEMTGIFILVQYLLSSQIHFLIIFLAPVYMFIRHFPSESDITHLFDKSINEINRELEKEVASH